MYQKVFENLLHRPIDPFRAKCFEQMDESRILNFIREYSNEVKKGMTFLENKKIIVTGLLHNAELQIFILKQWFDVLKPLCKEAHFVMVENNSVDNTRLFCEQWKESDPEHIHLVCNTKECNKPFTLKEDKSPESDRIEKMAFLRNLYVNYITEHFTSDVDFVFVMDFDLVGTLFWDGIFQTLNYFQNNPNIQAIACNGILSKEMSYYDSFAFARDKTELRWNNRIDKSNHDQDVLLYIAKEYESSQDLDKVSSAFGGFCIYQFSTFVRHRYGFEKNRYTCEHCLFHEFMDQVYVNPNMVFLIDENLT